ncbi:unnamed protein product, partial [Mesorhabditis spiculigera]
MAYPLTQLAAFILLHYSLGYPSKIIIKSFTTRSENTEDTVRALQYAEEEINGREENPFSGLADTLELPLITATPYAAQPELGAIGFELAIRPSPCELLADLIVLKGWTNVVLISDMKHQGVSLPLLWHWLHIKSNASVSAQLVEMPADEETFDNFLREFNLRRSASANRILIDSTSISRLKKFLMAIRAAQFNQANYHYVVANFDFLPYDIELFQHGNINVTGFQIIDRDQRSLFHLKRYLRKELQRDKIDNYDDAPAHVGFAHDAMMVAWWGFSRALLQNDSLFHGTFRHGKFYNRGYEGIYCDPSADRGHPGRPFASFEHGLTIIRAMRGLRLGAAEGTLTGHIEFDMKGQRIRYESKVIDLVSNIKSAFNMKEVMVWRQGHGFIVDKAMADHSRKQLEGRSDRVVRVATTLVHPFVMLKEDCRDGNNRTECLGNNRFEGYCIDLLDLLIERIQDFHYEIRLTDKTGSKKPDGSWDGLVGELLDGRADVAVASLTINQDRERVLDFSKPFMTTGISIMIKKPDKQELSVFSFMQPLSSEIWMYIIFAYVGVSVVIFLVSRFSPYEWRVEETARGGFTISNDFSVYNCLCSISGRIASSAWWFFTMIIVSSYTANLAAFLTLEKMQAPIESVDDLAKQSKIKYGIQAGGSTAQFFKHSSVQIYQKMWRYMESQVPSVFVSSYAEGIERVRTSKGRYAFLLEATANEYENTRKPCDTMKVGANLNSIGYGVATPFGSDWKDHINLAILALQEKGELKKLENKWWYDLGQCDAGIPMDGSSASLNLSKVAGIFYILMGGMVASMVAALGEFLYRSRIEARKNNAPSLTSSFAKNLKSALSSQLRLSIKGGAVAQPGTQSHDALRKQKAASFLPASSEDQKSTDRNPTFPYNTAV